VERERAVGRKSKENRDERTRQTKMLKGTVTEEMGKFRR
jgi:hypothetical protein